MSTATMIMIPPMVGTPVLFTLNGSIDASRCVSVICLRFSKLMKYSPNIAEISSERITAINALNDTYPNMRAPGKLNCSR